MDRYAAERILRRLPANVSVVPTVGVEARITSADELIKRINKAKTKQDKIYVLLGQLSEEGWFGNGVAAECKLLQEFWAWKRANEQEAA